MEKVSKRSVNYREAEGKQRCGNCSMFRLTHGPHDGTCTLVLGDIYKNDTCDEWQSKD